jgi:basic amino acid/polyamine antiporter, APA family
VITGIGALNGWTLVITEASGAPANDDLFPRAFAWADRKDTAAVVRDVGPLVQVKRM